MMKAIREIDVKHALKDERFRKSLPESLQEGAKKFVENPGCGHCHNKYIRQVLKEAKKQIAEYFPNREISDPDEELEALAKNNWQVINCTIDELEGHLQKIPKGRVQLDVARWENMVTVVVNHLEILF